MLPEPSIWAWEMLVGAVDTHVHSAPDIVERVLDDRELARSAARHGLGAVILKSHLFSTAERATLAQPDASETVILGGVVLNGTVGGINPDAVEATLRSGGRIVWMPTATAENELVFSSRPGHRKHPGALSRTRSRIRLSEVPVALLDEIIALVRDADAVLATGHLAADEIRALIERSGQIGLRNILVTHPDHPVIGLPIGDQIAMAERGVFFERCYNSFIAGQDQLIVDSIKRVGYQSTVLASDLGGIGKPDPITGFAAYLEALVNQGVAKTEVAYMSHTSASRLLAL